ARLKRQVGRGEVALQPGMGSFDLGFALVLVIVRGEAVVERPCDVAALAALLEKGADSIPDIIVAGTAEIELLLAAVDPLELDERRDDVGLDVRGTVAGRTDEARRGGADPFDRLGAVGYLLHEHAGRWVFGHGVSPAVI